MMRRTMYCYVYQHPSMLAGWHSLLPLGWLARPPASHPDTICLVGGGAWRIEPSAGPPQRAHWIRHSIAGLAIRHVWEAKKEPCEVPLDAIRWLQRSPARILSDPVVIEDRDEVLAMLDYPTVGGSLISAPTHGPQPACLGCGDTVWRGRTRGLCEPCYRRLGKAVLAGHTSWAEAEKAGTCTPTTRTNPTQPKQRQAQSP